MPIVMAWNETRSCSLGKRIEVANSSSRRAKGLLGKAQITEEEGMWIKPSSGVHTFFMRFPIDVIGLDRHGYVVCICDDVQPYRIAALRWDVHSVLELHAGIANATGTRRGDVLKFQKTTA